MKYENLPEDIKSMMFDYHTHADLLTEEGEVVYREKDVLKIISSILKRNKSIIKTHDKMTAIDEMLIHLKKLYDEGRIESVEVKNSGGEIKNSEGEIIFPNYIPLSHNEGGFYEIKFLIRK